MKNKLYSIVTNIVSQIVSQCDGEGDYNYDLKDGVNVKPEFVEFLKNTTFPLVCIASASENLTPVTFNTRGSNVSMYKPGFEIEMFAYVRSSSSAKAMPECLKLLSDIENALLVDDTLGSEVSNLLIQSSTGNYDAIGVTHIVLTGTYSGR